MTAAKVMTWWMTSAEPGAENELPEGYRVVEVLQTYKGPEGIAEVQLLLEAEPVEYLEVAPPVIGDPMPSGIERILDELRTLGSPSHIDAILAGEEE